MLDCDYVQLGDVVLWCLLA